MATDKNLTVNTTQNFILKGFNSIQIGLYILLASYVINDSILGFVAEENPMGMLSVEIIETICLFMIVLVGFFSMLAVFFSSRRASRKAGEMVWNAASKKQFLSYFVSFVLGVFLLVFVKNTAIINLSHLQKFHDNKKIDLDTPVDLKLLQDKKIINKKYLKLKILGDGNLKNKATITTNFISKQAQDKIEKAGGTFNILKKSSRVKAVKASASLDILKK